VANSLCRRQGKRTICEPEVQIGNSGTKERSTRKAPALAPAQIDGLRRLDSATVANAVETFGVRLPNRGFTDSRIHCLFPDFPPMLGYAVTARFRTANPPMEVHTYIDRRTGSITFCLFRSLGSSWKTWMNLPDWARSSERCTRISSARSWLAWSKRG